MRSISHKEDMGNKVGEYLKYLTGGLIHQKKYLAISTNQFFIISYALPHNYHAASQAGDEIHHWAKTEDQRFPLFFSQKCEGTENY